MGTFLFSVMSCFQKIVIMNCCHTFFSNIFFIPLLCVMAQRRFVEHKLGSQTKPPRSRHFEQVGEIKVKWIKRTIIDKT